WQSQAPRHHGGAPAQTRSERVLEKPNEPPLSEGHTFGSREGSMEHQFELTANVPITPYDSPLPGGYTPGSDGKEKDAQAVEILILKKRVQRLERQRKSSTYQPRRRKYRHVESSDDDLNKEDASKQRRSSDKTKPMLLEKKYPLVKELLEKMLNLQLEAEEESIMAFELINFIKSMLEEYRIFTKGRKTKPKRQYPAREQKERDEKPKSKSQSQVKVNPVKVN
ncbi:hypothetical protein Tco_0745015, partial [Tanacetum coccineum]